MLAKISPTNILWQTCKKITVLFQDYDIGQRELSVQLSVVNRNSNPGVRN